MLFNIIIFIIGAIIGALGVLNYCNYIMTVRNTPTKSEKTKQASLFMIGLAIIMIDVILYVFRVFI